jgi:hypothetical protein
VNSDAAARHSSLVTKKHPDVQYRLAMKNSIAPVLLAVFVLALSFNTTAKLPDRLTPHHRQISALPTAIAV